MVQRIIVTSLLLVLAPLWAAAATVNLPKTGQTLCYGANGTIDCANTGQDGETQIGATWPSPRFTDNLNGTVTDNFTGLTWLQDALCTALNPPAVNGASQGGRDWVSALAAANALRSGQCGLSDGSIAGIWRLPNVNEMESLVDFSRSNPPLPANNHFINIPANPIYWTSTITADYYPGVNAIGEDMFTGKIQGDEKITPKYIWPVKGDSTTLARTGQHTCWDPADTSASGTATACNGSGSDGDLRKGVPLPSPRFYDNGNGTTTDSLTGLIWPRNAGYFGNISSQGQALSLAKNLSSGACDLNDSSVPGDWRLPNIKELRSLVDYAGGWLVEFLGAPPHGWYWSSDSNPVAPDTSQKWMVKSQGLDWLSSELVPNKQDPPYYMLAVRGALKVQRITFNGPATICYGDPPLDLSTITAGGGSGNPVTFTLVSGPASLSGSTLTFTGGGNVVVQASQSGGGAYYPAAVTPHTFSVSSLSGTVVITPADLIRTYDGTPKPVTAATNPAGLAVTFSYAGSATPPTNAGSYPVTATINDPAHQGSTSGILVIGKPPCTVTLGGLSRTYDGAAQTVTPTTSPAGANVTVTYAGSATAPTNAGTYPVVATITDANYQENAATGDLVIAKATATVTLESLSQVYDGSAKSATATTSPAGKTVSFNHTPANPINAGSYAVIATVTDANYQGNAATGNLVIAKATATVTLESLSQVYDGTAKSATATTSPAGKTVSFSYTPANPVNAGSYAVVGTVSDANYAGTASSSLTVTRKAPTVTWNTPAAITSGTALSATQLNATGSVPGSFAYTPAAGAVPAGTQTLSVIFTPTDAANYTTASASVLLTVAAGFTVTFDPGGGSLTGTASQSVASGASTSAVTAVPAIGFHFVQWTDPDGFTSTSNPLTVTNVTANQTLTANYAVNTFLVTGSAPGGNGSISCAPSPVSYGANCSCTVTADAGYHVFTLTDNDADRMSALSGGTLTIAGVSANHLVSATFARPNGILNPAAGKTLPDIADALAVLQMALKIIPCTAADLARADIAPLGPDAKPSGDGKLDIYDVIGILRMSIGL